MFSFHFLEIIWLNFIFFGSFSYEGTITKGHKRKGDSKLFGENVGGKITKNKLMMFLGAG